MNVDEKILTTTRNMLVSCFHVFKTLYQDVPVGMPSEDLKPDCFYIVKTEDGEYIADYLISIEEFDGVKWAKSEFGGITGIKYFASQVVTGPFPCEEVLFKSLHSDGAWHEKEI